MTLTLTILVGLLLVMAIAFFAALCVWLFRHYRITFPMWLILAPVVAALVARGFANEMSMLFYQMTDVSGMSAQVVAHHLLVLRLSAAATDALSKLGLTVVGISELIMILDQTTQPVQGFWRKFETKQRARVAIGLLAVSLAALAAAIPGLYYHTL